jgi:hypothetical protein
MTPLRDSDFPATALGFSGGLPFTGLDLALLAGGSALFAAAGMVARGVIGRLARPRYERRVVEAEILGRDPLTERNRQRFA